MKNQTPAAQSILQEYYKGNNQPLANFFKEQWNLLLLRAYKKLKSIEWAKDVLQDMFLNFLSCPPEKRPTKLKSNIHNLLGFFVRVTEREAINAFLKKTNQDKHVKQMLEHQYSGNRNLHAMPDNDHFNFLEEDKKEAFIQAVQAQLEKKAAKNSKFAIDIKVFKLMLLVQSRDIAKELDLSVPEVEVIKKRVTRIMKKIRIQFL